MKKLLVFITFGAVLFPIVVTLTAQTNGVPVGGAPPASPLEWANLIITVLTPLVIAGLKWGIPKIPKALLPFIAPVVGVILDQVLAFTTAHQSNLVIGAIAGALGVWLREATVQAKAVIGDKQNHNVTITTNTQ